MDLSPLFKNAVKTAQLHAPEILTGLGVTGVVATGVLAVKAGMKSQKVLNAHGYEDFVKTHPSRKHRIEYAARLTWKQYIPPAASGAATIAFILAGHKSSANRTAAAVAAYSLTEKAFGEYKEAAKEELGKAKEQRMRDDMAQEKVTKNPPPSEVSFVLGDTVLCLDQRSMRYFRSTHEALKRAENEINFQLNHERTVGLSEFYALIGLPITKESAYTGWDLNRGLMELDISTTISDNEQPCFVIDFNYCQPLHDHTLCEFDR